MEIYYVDENGSQQPLSETKEQNSKLTPDSLKNIVRDMHILADVEILSQSRGLVRVHKHIGTTMYLANGEDNHNWLNFHSIKKEDKGSVTVYHFVFD